MLVSSCGSVFDDLEPCPAGVEMRFVYTYNLEGANAFAAQVDCLTLYIYDREGKYVGTLTETTEALAEEDYRMTIALAPGTYHAIAYGGIACARASFEPFPIPSASSIYTDNAMALKSEAIGTRLHDHFHGAVDFTISDNATAYTAVTMPMTKTTNHLRIIMQQIDGAAVDGNDYDFYIYDDNALLDHSNTPVAGHPVTYTSWDKGMIVTPGEDSRADDMCVGYADLSTSRLWIGNRARLVIHSKVNDSDIVDMPLNTILSYSNVGTEGWSDQEYLDRCSRWNLTFFLDRNNMWINTRIIINGWTVRINDIN
ncbi:MAG: FimB/Mfa2 family fimbrial subunit [Muribaculaceae bacterium]